MIASRFVRIALAVAGLLLCLGLAATTAEARGGRAGPPGPGGQGKDPGGGLC